MFNFLSGTVTIKSLQNNENQKFPLLGERLGFLGGEFYIESARHNWQMMGEMTTTLGVSRGFKYSQTGEQSGIIDNVGQKIKTLEATDA